MSSLDGLLWVFGYGSLIWKPPEGFQHVKSIPGGIKGWQRRLWQGSTDHRGLPGAPGLVATLLKTEDLPETDRPAADDLCWGMCYGYDESQRDTVLQYLDYREKDGYDRTRVDVYLAGGRGGEPDILNVLLYVATTDNPQYLGPLSNQEVAERVATAVGPSGTNHEYVTNLANGLAAIKVKDEHVEEVVARLGSLQLAAAGARASAFVGDGQHTGDGGWMLQRLWEVSDVTWTQVQGSPGLYQGAREGEGEGEGEGEERRQLLERIGWPSSMSPAQLKVRLPASCRRSDGGGGQQGSPLVEEAVVEEAVVARFPCGGGLIHRAGQGPELLLCTEAALTRALEGAATHSN